MKPFYVTTPIYYVNDKPHIGHAYTTILADVLAQYHRLLDVPTFFLTGTDEHGQKVAQAAAAGGRTPQAHADATVVPFQELWRKLEITHDDFIRTTEERHQTVVKKILQDLYDRDEIYSAEYEGWYCVPCERFFTEKDLVESNCPDCHRPVERIVEQNYFFRMSKYQDWLIQYIEDNPEFIQPDFRRNETLGFLRQPLGDLCISRPKARLSWGIELPFDSDYVCYVWFDALVNYISGVGYLADDEKFRQWWPATYHLVGKDILTTHTVYWPTMLKAIDLPLPRTVFAHGWWLIGRDKMGKSMGNVVDPMQMASDYGVDAFRYFLMAEMSLGQDASFSDIGFFERYNTDLADQLGNMVNRVLKLIPPNFQGCMPEPGPLQELDTALRDQALAAVDALAASVDGMQLHRGIAVVMDVVRACNRYFEQTAPWALVKQGETARLATVLYCAAEALRIVSGLLYPVMPAKMQELRRALGMTEDLLVPHVNRLRAWGTLQPGSKVGKVQALFPRIDINAKQQAAAPREPNGGASRSPAAAAEGVVELIDIQQFGQVKLKTARIITAEPVKGADRLLKLQIEVGAEQRQLVAGIAQHYTPADLPGRLIVIVANLKPAKIRGIESNGMLLAAKHGKALQLITVDGDVPSGIDIG